MSAVKMKVYRKDRLYASDKDKTECLIDTLKNVRITDESAYFCSGKNQHNHDRDPPNVHSPNLQGHRLNVPRSGAGGGPGPGPGGPNGSTGGPGSFNSGAKGSGGGSHSYTPSGD